MIGRHVLPAILSLGLVACQSSGSGVAPAVEASSSEGATLSVESAPADYEEIEGDDSGVPDLTGTWTAKLRSIYTGALPLGLEAAEGADIDYLRVTIDIEIQDSRLFYGTIRSDIPGSQASPQEVFGAIRSNGESAVYITRNGRGTMYILSPDEIEVCGGRGGVDVMLAFCSPLHRAEAAE